MPEDINKIIGDELRKLRQSRGMSTRKLVTNLQLSGINITEISLRHWESGRRKISLSNFIFICKALSVDLEEIGNNIICKCK